MYSTNCLLIKFYLLLWRHDDKDREWKKVPVYATLNDEVLRKYAENYFKKGDGTIISIHNTGVDPVWAKYLPCNKLWRQSMTIISLRNSEGVFMDHLLVIIILNFFSDAWKCKLMHHTKFCEGNPQKKKKIVLRLDLMIVKDWTVCQPNSFYRF